MQFQVKQATSLSFHSFGLHRATHRDSISLEPRSLSRKRGKILLSLATRTINESDGS